MVPKCRVFGVKPPKPEVQHADIEYQRAEQALSRVRKLEAAMEVLRQYADGLVKRAQASEAHVAALDEKYRPLQDFYEEHQDDGLGAARVNELSERVSELENHADDVEKSQSLAARQRDEALARVAELVESEEKAWQTVAKLRIDLETTDRLRLHAVELEGQLLAELETSARALARVDELEAYGLQIDAQVDDLNKSLERNDRHVAELEAKMKTMVEMDSQFSVSFDARRFHVTVACAVRDNLMHQMRAANLGGIDVMPWGQNKIMLGEIEISIGPDSTKILDRLVCLEAELNARDQFVRMEPHVQAPTTQPSGMPDGGRR